jgi:hypothetical protein
MKTHRYLTPEMARQLKPGQVLKLGYDDFNKASFTYTHKSASTADSPFGERLEITGTFDYGEGDPFEGVLYECSVRSPGQPVMCSGSGSERIFIRK